MTSPWVPDAVINGMCEGLTQDAAKVRYLRRLGLTVDTKPNGKPLVLNSNVEAIFGGHQEALDTSKEAVRQPVQPNRAGLVLQFGRNGA